MNTEANAKQGFVEKLSGAFNSALEKVDFSFMAPNTITVASHEPKKKWVVAARAEGDDSPFPEKIRFTPERLQQIADSYDPGFRVAKVICGYDPDTGVAGPAHHVGPWNKPVTPITALNFDGVNLWAQIEDNDRLRSLVDDGFDQYSVYASTGIQGLEKDEWYLRHVALLGGENPGIPAMPAMGEMLRSADGSSEIIRTIPSSFLEDEKPEPLEEAEMKTEETLNQLLASVEALTQKVEGIEQTVAKAAAEAEGSARVAKEALEGVQGLTAEARSATVEQRLERLVADGKVRPSERTAMAEFIARSAADTEAVNAFLDALDAREAVMPNELTLETTLAGRTDGVPGMIPKNSYFPVDNADPASLALYRKAAEGAETEEDFRKNVYALVGGQMLEPPAPVAKDKEE